MSGGPDTAERHRLAVEDLVDGLMWWLRPGSEPPPSIAALGEAEREELWRRLDRLARSSGQAAMSALLANLSAWNHSRQTTNVNGPSDSVDL